MNNKRLLTTAMISLVGLLPTVCMAEIKHEIGISSYALSADAGSLYVGGQKVADLTVDNSGAALVYTGSVNDNAAFRVDYYSLSVDSISDIQVTGGNVKGYDLQLLFGTGLSTTGFKAYVSPGYFSETVSFDGIDATQDFSGLELGAGFGYNWESVSVELWGNWRSGKDYDDFLSQYLPPDVANDVSTKVVSAGVSIGVRF